MKATCVDPAESPDTADRPVGTLEKAAAAESGIQIERLWAGDRLVVRTATAVYDLTIIAPKAREVVVRGTTFAGPVAARLEGCSSDGAFLKAGTIAVGCAMELRTASGLVVTGPVHAIAFTKHA